MPHAKVEPDLDSGGKTDASAPATTKLQKSKSTMGTRKLARKYQKKNRNNLLGNPCCAPCGTFMAIAVFFVPLLVFLVAAICAVPIWGMECLWQTGPVAGPESDVCVYYEWWKYVMGNLVGLATPLTNVAPRSGHVLSEIFDLLVSVWGVALTGLIIGVIANLTFVKLLVKSSDGTIVHKVGSLLVNSLALQVEDLAKDIEGMTLGDFAYLCASSVLRLSEEKVSQIFAEADADNNGTIDADEAKVVVEKLRASSANAADPRVNELLATVAQLQASLEGLHAKLDPPKAPASPPAPTWDSAPPAPAPPAPPAPPPAES